MHARLQLVRTLPAEIATPESGRRLADVLAGHPGFRGVHLMLQIGTRQGLNLTLWDSRDDAEAAPARTQAVLGPRPFPLAFDEVYDVLASIDGPAASEAAAVVQASWFDGPRSAAESEAMRRAGEERIQPAIAEVPGLVATYVLCHPADSGVVVLTFATSTEALERVAEAVYATPLLPGEDPALLAGPDRVEIYRLAAQSPAPVAVS